MTLKLDKKEFNLMFENLNPINRKYAFAILESLSFAESHTSTGKNKNTKNIDFTEYPKQKATS